MTLRERINCCLSWEPYKLGATATQICHFLNVSAMGCESPNEVKLSSLSGQLCRMVNDGTLDVLPGYGPRGGNGYTLKHK